ncbi:MAG: hypothetical protein WDZ82_03100 [Candidatus Paceibacterota bacterium]
MITNKLLSYIKDERARGVSEAQIRKTLMAQGGWHQDDLKEAFQAVQKSVAQKDTPQKSAKAPASQSAAKQASASRVSDPIKKNKKDEKFGKDLDSQSESMQTNRKQQAVIPSHSSVGRKVVLFLVALLVFVGVAVGGVAAYTSIIGGVNEDLSKDEILSSAFSNFSDATSLEYEAVLTVESGIDGSRPHSLRVSADGVSSMGAAFSDLTMQHKVSVESETDGQEQGGSLIDTEVEMRLVDKILYFYVEHAPEMTRVFLPISEQQWLRSPEVVASGRTGSESGIGLDGFKDEATRRFVIDSVKLAREHRVYSITEIEEERINGEGVHAFSIRFHPQNIEVFFNDVVAMVYEREDLPDEVRESVITWAERKIQLSEEERAQEIERIKQVTDNLETEIMIGKRDMLPRRIRISFDGDVPGELVDQGGVNSFASRVIGNDPLRRNAMSVIGSAFNPVRVAGADFPLLLDLEIRFSGFNESVNVEAPADAIDFEAAIRDARIEGGSGSGDMSTSSEEVEL